jgi:hypothetical protein
MERFFVAIRCHCFSYREFKALDVIEKSLGYNRRFWKEIAVIHLKLKSGRILEVQSETARIVIVGSAVVIRAGYQSSR